MLTEEKTIAGTWYTITCTAAATVTQEIDGETAELAILEKSGTTAFRATASTITIETEGKYHILPTKAPAAACSGGTSLNLSSAQKAVLMADLEKETGHITPSGTTEDNANAYGFGCLMPRSGQVRELAVECRENGAALPTATEAWVKVWRGDTQLLAVSENSRVHELAGILRYSFPPFEVQAGEVLRVTFHAASDLEGNSYQPGLRCCLRARLLESGEGGGLLDADGGYLSTLWTAAYEWLLEADKFAPAAHAADTVMHLTTEEHSGLSELLAHKDELLALLQT